MQSSANLETCWADALFRADMMEYWTKHVRSKALAMVLRMFGVVEAKTDQASRAEALCVRKILVVPVEVVGLWLG
jgi:hypothetical protein